jgi:hypothetical protein
VSRGRRTTVLSPEHLTVCKAVFDRPKDWLERFGALAAAAR